MEMNILFHVWNLCAFYYHTSFCVIKNTEETMIPCNTLDIIRFCTPQRLIVLSDDVLQEMSIISGCTSEKLEMSCAEWQTGFSFFKRSKLIKTESKRNIYPFFI